jgi:hypothetical protein
MPAALNVASMRRGRRRIVCFEWLKTRPVDDAVWQSGLFTNRVTACTLRDSETIEYLKDAFGIIRSEDSTG